MSASLRALLTGVIDYAGMFPPAKLPMEEATRNYARYRQEPESWMLGRFLCPTSRLAELAPFCGKLFPEKPCVISAVGRGGATFEEFSSGLVADLEAITVFSEKLAVVDAFETRVPALANPDGMGKIASGMRYALRSSNLLLSLEIAFTADWRSIMIRLLQSIAPLAINRLPCCFKLRCGGLEASAIPPPEQIAFVIAACVEADAPLKFTAGLHHPIRHFNAEVQTKMHGFINVFVAGVLAHARNLREEQLLPIIEDEDSSHFFFDDNCLRWKDWSAKTDEIAAARKHVLSFGSCSFDEPRDDLRKLGWLP
jgi:hypothetical protein